MSLTIEKASPADAAELLAYLKQIGGETDNLSFGPEGLPFSVEDEAAYLAGMEGSTDQVMFVAKVDGKIVGDASLNRSPRRMGHRGELGISVVKSHWNMGIGSALLRKIHDFAAENEFEIIDLQVRSDNVRAIHLYQKFGFRKLCTYPGFIKIGDAYVDYDLMYLPL